MKPPLLKNDCFALPPGINWTPVDTALDLLRARLSCVVDQEIIDVDQALGRILAQDTSAKRANPPLANSAVDGYGFAAAEPRQDVRTLPLVDGRSAAGQPFSGTVPAGMAVRILTGASLPNGVDTVIMQEDTTVSGDNITFRGGLKAGANTRLAGEDMAAGELIFRVGQRLRPQDLALLVATGTASITVFRPLRVGVLSTGDEILPAGSAASPDQIFDANRPMLLALLDRWGAEAVDLGHVSDSRAALRDCLDEAAGRVDAILTSGGASSGDEDHLAALLSAEGRLHSWRIALKPGRPLALGQWGQLPLFGLPGNPVAAFTCALVFARPALGVLAGAGWSEPTGYSVPAGFSKHKKAGRREFLRARLDAKGRVAVFASEGSGRISGLSWADGLVELGDDGAEITPGTPVRYIPFSSFGL